MIRQSGVIPYRIQDGKVEVLLIKSASGKRWVIPKGGIPLWLTAAESAAKEAWEEAGIEGNVVTPAIGSYNIRKWSLPCKVEVFLMAVEREAEDYPEANLRKRQWMSLTKAIKQIREIDLKQLLKQLHQLEKKIPN